MLETLEPMHEVLETKIPSECTLREAGFFQSYGADLSEAWRNLVAYKGENMVVHGI